jgi:type II secretory pathway pseudopilin PulG
MKKENLKIKNKKEKAFTFIELLVALLVLAISVLSVIAVSAKSYTSISLQRNKLIATNLTREGLELIRYIRNKNWLYTSSSDCNEDDNITICSDGQIKEDGGDCDWRCGDEEDFSPSYKPQFKLGAPAGGKYLVDIEYYDKNNNQWVVSTNDTALDATEDKCETRIGKGDSQDSYHYPFARIISVKRGEDLNGDGNLNNDLLVKVIVCWKEKGKLNSVSSEEHLFNWYR